MLRRWRARIGAALLFCGFASAAAAQTDAERAQARAIYERIIAFDSSVEGGQTAAMADYLAARFRDGGFAPEDVHVLPVGDTAGLLVRYRGDGAGAAPVLFLAHMDVVPARQSDWERDPFTLIEENGLFYGRGASDNKAGVALLTATFLSLRAEGFTPTRDLLLWFSGDEETTGATTMALLNEHRALIGASAFAINSDAGGGVLREEDGAPLSYYVQTAEKTYASFRFTARNPGGHSSVPRPDNAIYALAEALTRLRAHDFPVMWNDTTLLGFRAAAETTSGAIGAAMRRFSQRPGDRGAVRTLSRVPGENAQMRTTCVTTLLEAGHAENALPQTAEATVNCRIFPGVGAAAVHAELQRIAGEDVEVTMIGTPFESDASPLRDDVMAAISAAVHANYPGVSVTPAMSSGATDGLYFRSAGIPTYGAGSIFSKGSDEFAHGLNERAPVESFYNGLTHWRVLIGELAGR